jgi:hypothetical protein
MAAISHMILARSAEAIVTFNHLQKRKNWAGKHPGVILVFAIIATVAILLIVLLSMKRVAARRAAAA